MRFERFQNVATFLPLLIN